MPKFMIERVIPGASALTPQQLAEISAKSNAVVAGLGVPYTWHTSFVAGDKVYCVHEAENEEAIRRHAAEGGFPVDRVTPISAEIGPETAKAVA
ncbi:DUF4242 domain-containing protein [Roseomonas sp. HF4]|uniref:DUF4242 domain-containing protein n=1 Tax=Roseomonas sp. HF4 TaxID=2562313 RepID=UPI0010BFAAD2|nr:DUF4242 domain-containing protein [Roseomonas sp. HF4]